MEETPKSEGVSPSKSGPTKAEGLSPSKSFPIKLAELPARVWSELKGVSPSKSTSADAGPLQELTNYEQLVARAVDVFGDEIKASKWLSLPNSELSGETPLQVAKRDGYDRQVLEPIFTRIEHGIYP
jgi:uncharacterized protein (DUF2384 family)